MNRNVIWAIGVPVGILCFALAADTFWQVYFAMESRTYDATVTSVAEVNRRGKRVTYERYQLSVRWTDEQGRETSGETETDRSQPVLVGDSLRIQYAARSGMIRLAKNQSFVGPMLFGITLTILAGLGFWMLRAASLPICRRGSRSFSVETKKPKRTRPLTRLKPIDPDADR